MRRGGSGLFIFSRGFAWRGRIRRLALPFLCRRNVRERRACVGGGFRAAAPCGGRRPVRRVLRDAVPAVFAEAARARLRSDSRWRSQWRVRWKVHAAQLAAGYELLAGSAALRRGAARRHWRSLWARKARSLKCPSTRSISSRRKRSTRSSGKTKRFIVCPASSCSCWSVLAKGCAAVDVLPQKLEDVFVRLHHRIDLGIRSGGVGAEMDEVFGVAVGGQRVAQAGGAFDVLGRLTARARRLTLSRTSTAG